MLVGPSFPRSTSLLVSLLAVVSLLSCDSGSTDSTTNPPYANPSPLEGETIGWSGTYVISNGRILFDYGSDTLEIRAWCDFEDPFQRELDSFRVPRFDTFDILLQNDSLALVKPLPGSPGDADSYGRLFVRAPGSSKGFEGIWKLEAQITIPDGGVPVADPGWGPDDPPGASEWILTMQAGKFSLVEKATMDWAAHFVRDWGNGVLRLPGKGDSIEAVRVDASVVRLTGRTTGEVVTVRRLGRHPFILFGGDWEYSSSDKSHTTFVQTDLPKTCPDLPYWFREFQSENSGPVHAARGVGSFEHEPGAGTSTRGAASGRGAVHGM